MKNLEQITSCPNCGYIPFDTHFCPRCGQRKLLEKDFKIWALTRDFFSGFLQLENSFFRTLKQLTRNPADYVSEYIQGARKKYISPIKLFLFANAFYFLFPIVNTFTTSLELQLNRQFYSSVANPYIESVIAASGLSFNEFEAVYNSATTTLSKALLILLPLFFALMTRLLYFNRVKPHSLLSHINYSLVLFSFALLVVLSVLPGIYYFIADFLNSEIMLEWSNNLTLSLGSLLVLNVYGIFLYRGFFTGKNWINLVRFLGLNLSFFSLIIFYRALLLFITIAWMKVF